jgi:hypothetical protein
MENVDDIALVSPITHVAFIRGIPARLTGTTWPTDNEEPSFDVYLMYLLYHDDEVTEIRGPITNMGGDLHGLMLYGVKSVVIMLTFFHMRQTSEHQS